MALPPDMACGLDAHGPLITHAGNSPASLNPDAERASWTALDNAGAGRLGESSWERERKRKRRHPTTTTHHASNSVGCNTLNPTEQGFCLHHHRTNMQCNTQTKDANRYHGVHAAMCRCSTRTADKPTGNSGRHALVRSRSNKKATAAVKNHG